MTEHRAQSHHDVFLLVGKPVLAVFCAKSRAHFACFSHVARVAWQGRDNEDWLSMGRLLHGLPFAESDRYLGRDAFCLRRLTWGGHLL